jgi:mannose-6-phosphate isomerase-like protein (cupin superfamily)
MSFNPTRLAPNKAMHRPSSPPPGAGITHSEIMKKHGGTSYAPAGNKKQSVHGYSIDLFSNDVFCTRFDVIHSKNNTGLGVNPDGDRTFLVVKGTAFVTVEIEGVRDILRLQPGNCFHAPRNTIYAVATSGTDGVELHVVETLGYATTWKQLDAPTIGEVIDFSAVQTMATQSVRRGPDPRTVAQAQDMAAAADLRRRTPKKQSAGPVASANSANVLGANPRPGGVGAFEE